MSTVRFVHCADLHLDTPFRGLASVDEERARALNNATFDSYANIIDLAIREQVDFVVIAGDVYDSTDRSLRAQFRFRDGLKQLADHGIRSFIAFGNHDPLNGWSNTLEWPELAHTFGGKRVDVCQVTREGETIASVHGISFPKEAVREDLSALFEQPDGGVPSIAVLHANVGGDTRHEPIHQPRWRRFPRRDSPTGHSAMCTHIASSRPTARLSSTPATRRAGIRTRPARRAAAS